MTDNRPPKRRTATDDSSITSRTLRLPSSSRFPSTSRSPSFFTTSSHSSPSSSSTCYSWLLASCVISIGLLWTLAESSPASPSQEQAAAPSSSAAVDGQDFAVYTDQFVAHVTGGPAAAQDVATKHGFIYLGQIFDDYYHLKHHKITRRSAQPVNESHTLTSGIHDEPTVHSLRQQTLKSRAKRDFLRLSPSAAASRAGSPQQSPDHSGQRFNDPRYGSMWYLNRGQGLDMNVESVWEKKITGKGVVVTILDDGLEKNHPDLIANYDPEASYDVNNHDDDPMPRYDMIDSNRHGTRCAGEVAADANNSICAVGVAFNARVGGVRMLDGDVTDAVEARSLSLNPQHIQIYSASWGPDDDGKTVDGPGELATRAFVDGVTKGRSGLGSIFVWASGNGGREHDNCNCDGYTNSIWTLSISSATENGLVPWYSEACSSTLATTYSSGSFGERQIITTDLHHGCTSSHTGTSASAPLAAGICALALEANSNLTWRDMQHIVVQTAHPANLHARDWYFNKVTGRNVSHSFGYGLMDADAMVETARDWVTAPAQKTCEVQSHPIDKLIPAKSHVELQLQVSCDNVRFLEHVQAKVTLTATRRGDIHIYLTSPSGTRSTLLAQRPMDNSRSGFQNWPFMTVHSWGENPSGIWKLEVHNEGRYYSRAYLKEWTLIMYGTSTNPDRRKRKFQRPSLSPPLVTPSVLSRGSTSSPTRSPLPGRFVPTMGSLPGKAVVVVEPFDHNHLDEEDTQPELALSDSHRNLHKSEHEYPVFHGTRADKSEDHLQRSEGSSSSSSSSSATGAICALKGPSSECLGCILGYYLVHGRCTVTCPDGYYAFSSAATPQGDGPSGGLCLRCHYSCKRCSSSAPTNCSTCYEDAELHRNGRCHAREIVEEVIELEQWYTAVTVVFLCLCFVIVVLVMYIVVEKQPQVLCCWTKSSRHRPGTAYEDLPLKRERRGPEAHAMNLKGSSSKRPPVPTTAYRDDLSEDDL